MKLFKLSAFVLGFVLLLQGISPAQAVTNEISYAAEDFVSARLQATITDHRILVISELSETSTTWVNPDGTLTTESFGSPVRVRDGAGEFGWRDLDFTLEFTDAGVEARSGFLPLIMSSGGSSDLVTFGGEFGFKWDGILPRPVLFEDTARYVEVLPGVDLLVRLDGAGFEQFFEVKSYPSEETLGKLALLLDNSSVSVAADGSGGYSFRVRGEEVAGIVAPNVYDSAAVANSEPISLGVSQRKLHLQVDPAFFADPRTVYPVIVDPAFTLNPSFDTYVSSEDTTVNFEADASLWIGTVDGGATVYRSYLNFNSSSWQGMDVVSANLNLYLASSGSCTPKYFSVFGVPATASGTVWGNAPALTGSFVSQIASGGYNATCGAKYVSVDVVSLLGSADSVSGTIGFGVKATNETEILSKKRFNSSNAYSNKPYLTVTYNMPPGAASTPSVTGASASAGVLSVGSAKPELVSQAVDPDGNSVKLTFKTYADASSLTPTGTLCFVTVASGSQGACRPTNSLVDQQTYFVRAISDDGRITAAASSVVVFKVLATPPVTPTITCPYANGYQSAGIPTSSFTCLVSLPYSAASSRAIKITIAVDGKTPEVYQTAVDGSFNRSIQFSSGAYRHTITATSSSSTGILSNTASHAMTFGSVGVISPQKLVNVSSSVVVSGYALPSGSAVPTLASIEWRRNGDSGAWNSAVSGLPVSTVSGLRGLYNYKLNVSTLGAYGVAPLPHNVPVTVDLRFCFHYGLIAETVCSENSVVSFTRWPNGYDNAQADAEIGSVSLVTGKFTTATTDFSQQVGLHSLAVSRTFTGGAQSPNTASGVFGNGWLASFSSDASALAGYTLTSDAGNGRYYLISPDQEVLEYQGAVTPVAVNEAAIAANLQVSVTSSTVTFTESTQSITTFSKASDGSWLLGCARSDANSRAVISLFDAAGRVTDIGYASNSTSGCSGTTVTQGLHYVYNSSGLLTSVYYKYLDATSNAVISVLEVSYLYNSSSRLIKVTNETNGSSTAYEYNSSNDLVKITVSGFATYVLKYDSQDRLVQVVRTQSSFWGTVSSVAKTFVYDIAPAGNTGYLPNLPASTTSHWGQTSAPSYAAAVFGADTQLILDSAGNVSVPAATDSVWRNAAFMYVDGNGNQSNTASYGKDKWLYTAQLANPDGVVYASFDAYGITRVLDQFAAENSDAFDELMYASVFSYQTSFTSKAMPSGVYLAESWSPVKTVVDTSGLSGTFRTHSTYTYDEGSPSGAFFGLVTSTITGLTSGTSLTAVNAQVLAKTVNTYDPQVPGTVSGWTIGSPTKVSTFDGLNNLVASSKRVFNDLGQVVSSVGVASTGLDARTENTTYYTASANSLHPECGGKPAWQDLVCVVETGEVTPSSKTWVESYDARLNAAIVNEYRSGVLSRTGSYSYLADNRLDYSIVSAPGAVSIKTKHFYDPVSLLEVKTQLFYGNAYQSETAKTYDAWGRPLTETNSLGDVTSTTYVAPGSIGAGNVASVVSPKTNTNYTFGSVTDPRAVITSMTVSNNDFSYQYTGVYDQFGRLVTQAGPNGVTQSFTFNDAGQLASMSYGGVAGLALTWTRTYDGFGRVYKEASSTGSSTLYGYDSSSRLASANSTNLTESYSYDAFGDRTSSNINGLASTHTFNSESQVTNTGYVYDALGRNTFIPAVDAPNNNGGISLSYNVVDQVTSITQATSTSFTYDALGRRVNETNSGLTTQRHYTDGSDNPEWTSQLDGSLLTTEIYTGSLGAGLGVTTNIKGTTKTQTIQLTDLRGHTVTTLNLSTNSVSPLITYDSFGNPQSSQTSTNLINYSSYGQQERATNNTGLIFMGARLYNPKTNQFTSKDPISRGNENPYTYPNDPINTGDFSGLWSEWVSEMIFVILTILSIYYCPATEGVGCAFALVLGGVGGGLDSFNESVNAGRPWWEIAGNTLVGIGLGLFGMKYISKIVSKYGPKLVQFLISPEGLQKSYLSIPAFLKRFSKEYVAGKTTDSLVKTTYDLLVTYLAKLFSDRPKK